MKSKLLKAYLLVLASALVMFISMSDASAQTKKKKRVAHRTPTTKTKSTPTSGDAGVVSLADQYSDTSSQIIDPSTPTATPSPELPDETTKKLRDMQSRIKKLEAGSKSNNDDDKQKRLLTNLDILTKSEQRVEALRKQRFELIEKENTIRQRLDQIDIESRPEMIERSVATAGSLRPEELRDAKRKSLDAEKRNLQSLLAEIVATRSSLDQSVQKADALVEKIRTKLEKDIDDALDPDKPEQ